MWVKRLDRPLFAIEPQFGHGGAWDWQPPEDLAGKPVATLELPGGRKHEVYKRPPQRERLGACLAPR